ncbi:taurine dioxygenase [Microlunatus sagamiharensis]|uniref:Taurine dioxygenase n=1 Tax=Microlunatus sagamiharensis TaxID=546874 RepID=A0A1H2LST2_9ACTN|nr:TauD/TfdA family dioxygenase [Microlunatus sagamiharensis]SDU83366.1 taurine dioxygenase [Microlunatus sagamiharensis]
MIITRTEPLGARVEDVDLTRLGDDDVSALTGLLAAQGVVVFPGQRLDDAEFTAFLRRFGRLVFTVGETPVPDHPDLNVISNVGRTTAPRSTFHVDSSYFAAPPAYTALRTVTVPREGGQTEFSNQYRAHDTLEAGLRERLEGRTLTHVVTGVELSDDDESSAVHPLLRRHPVSGRTSLYLTTPARCASISGLDAEQTKELVERLYAHSTRPDNLYRHAWAEGDVVMWDNGCVLHRADHSGVVGDRVMHRGMATGYATADPGLLV